MAKKYTWCFLLVLMSIAIVAAHIGEMAVPAVFIFGDSTMDVGTNNFLPVSQEIKADFYYNGIDYPFSEPTGRFSNGYNTADRIGIYVYLCINLWIE